jgi:hypothetical protein
MKRNMKKKSKNNDFSNSDYSLAHVLYQKLGNDWYAFTEVDGDCFMTKVNEEDSNVAQLHASQPTIEANTRKRRAA